MSALQNGTIITYLDGMPYTVLYSIGEENH